MKRAICWFRRDLRVTDQPALAAAAREAEEVVCVYVASTWRGRHRWTGPMRQQFLCGCLASLDANLRALGSSLLIREGEPVETLLRLATEAGASAIFLNRSPDPFGQLIERRLEASAASTGIQIRGFQDAVLHEPGEVLTATGEPFRVFTPYSRAWWKLPKARPGGKIPRLKSPAALPSLPLPTLDRWGLRPEGSIPEAGERAARRRLQSFLASGIAKYGAERDILAGTTTSRLSQDLRFGLLSIREVFARCEEAAAGASRASALKFISELIWREFYIAILGHFPEVLDTEFNPRYRGMPWPGAATSLERWKNAETGFPIVDAAMRQLHSTGFMHNRARMITAMFLTKDLHVDWREGERHFMQYLVDGEIASNNGGWQWSAGTGADAAPYFRIQNPWTQTARYDSEGLYIKTWLPELRDVPPSLLQSPPPPGQKLAPGYPPPIVDHAAERDKTLDLFKSWERRAAHPAHPG
ncbi:MAG: DNA photolyase family protein [Terrimicrobiaceae bacterium]|nr:DNA photolyase family protein [Terrimicrobiaceae bacterium]